MSARKAYIMKAKCLGNGCRSVSVAKHNGTCGLPKCLEQVSLFNPRLVKRFVGAVRLDPKSAAAKRYYSAIMDDWESVRAQAAINKEEEAARIISEEKQLRLEALSAAINNPQVFFLFNQFFPPFTQVLLKFPFGQASLLFLAFPCLSSFLNLFPFLLLFP